MVKIAKMRYLDENIESSADESTDGIEETIDSVMKKIWKRDDTATVSNSKATIDSTISTISTRNSSSKISTDSKISKPKTTRRNYSQRPKPRTRADVAIGIRIDDTIDSIRQRVRDQQHETKVEPPPPSTSYESILTSTTVEKTTENSTITSTTTCEKPIDQSSSSTTIARQNGQRLKRSRPMPDYESIANTYSRGDSPIADDNRRRPEIVDGSNGQTSTSSKQQAASSSSVVRHQKPPTKNKRKSKPPMAKRPRIEAPPPSTDPEPATETKPIDDWAEDEKQRLVDAIQLYGCQDIPRLREAVKTRSTLDVLSYVRTRATALVKYCPDLKLKEWTQISRFLLSNRRDHSVPIMKKFLQDKHFEEDRRLKERGVPIREPMTMDFRRIYLHLSSAFDGRSSTSPLTKQENRIVKSLISDLAKCTHNFGPTDKEAYFRTIATAHGQNSLAAHGPGRPNIREEASWSMNPFCIPNELIMETPTANPPKVRSPQKSPRRPTVTTETNGRSIVRHVII